MKHEAILSEKDIRDVISEWLHGVDDSDFVRSEDLEDFDTNSGDEIDDEIDVAGRFDFGDLARRLSRKLLA